MQNIKQGITTYREFKIVVGLIKIVIFSHLAIAFYISIENPVKNPPELIKGHPDLSFWVIYLLSLLITIYLVKIFELKNNIVDLCAGEYYKREIKKIVIIEQISIVGIVLIIATGFKWIYLLPLLTPIILMIKYFPGEFKEAKPIQ